MVWVRFTADMDWKPRPSVTIAYEAGMVCNVTRAAAKAAIDRRRALAMTKASRKAEPREARDEA